MSAAEVKSEAQGAAIEQEQEEAFYCPRCGYDVRCQVAEARSAESDSCTCSECGMTSKIHPPEAKRYLFERLPAWLNWLGVIVAWSSPFRGRGNHVRRACHLPRAARIWSPLSWVVVFQSLAVLGLCLAWITVRRTMALGWIEFFLVCPLERPGWEAVVRYLSDWKAGVSLIVFLSALASVPFLLVILVRLTLARTSDSHKAAYYGAVHRVVLSWWPLILILYSSVAFNFWCIWHAGAQELGEYIEAFVPSSHGTTAFVVAGLAAAMWLMGEGYKDRGRKGAWLYLLCLWGATLPGTIVLAAAGMLLDGDPLGVLKHTCILPSWPPLQGFPHGPHYYA